MDHKVDKDLKGLVKVDLKDCKDCKDIKQAAFRVPKELARVDCKVCRVLQGLA